MSTWPGPSALDARTQAFPVLTAAQISRLRLGSTLRKVEPGEILFQPDDTEVPFFVLLSGSMEIVQPDLTGERPIATHGPGEFTGEFTGEITMISGQRCLVRGRVTEAGEFLEISAHGLRLVARDAELGEILMRAFILRRLALISAGYGNAILMGSRHSANTLRLHEFLSRNGYPHTYVDLDTDKTSQELLDRFAVKPEEVPVVICHGRTVLRNPSTQEGDTGLERVTWRNGTTGKTSTHVIRHVFVMTGASPGTEWLKGCVALDDKGFILTGRDLDGTNGTAPTLTWPLRRPPQMLETSLPGVFAVGDVRPGNVKRVASAAGEGAIAVHLVHRTLAEL